MGLLTQSDAHIFQSWFKEMCRLHGITVKYTYPITSQVSTHAEFDNNFAAETNLDIVFEEIPKVNTLKRIGWVSENPDDKPCIAYMPIDTPFLQMHSRVLIPPIGQAIPGRWFEVTSIHSNLEYPDCYICTLVPVFNSVPAKSDYDQTNYNYIEHERANQPDEDQPANNPVNANFTFLTNFNG